MDDNKLMEHISHILYCGYDRNIELSLIQLRDILKKNDAPAEQLLFVGKVLGVTRELAELSVLKYGEEISRADIEKLLDRINRR